MESENNLLAKLIAPVILAIIFLMPGLGVWTIVSAGHVGVVTRMGAVNRVANPGFVLKLPLIEGVTSMETRTQKEQIDAASASSDLQEVKATIALNFHLRGEKAVDVYQNIGTEYADRILSPAMQEAFKATTAKFTASDLIGKREAVKVIAYTELKERLDKYNIVVDDFNIVNFDFSKEFNDAIEAKTVANQTLEKTKIEAETALTQAQGQANAQKALKDSGALSPEYLQYLALTKWQGQVPTYWGGNALPFIGVK